ncbi:hypothetical protein ACEH97_004797 [Vibrio alginolyticus]
MSIIELENNYNTFQSMYESLNGAYAFMLISVFTVSLFSFAYISFKGRVSILGLFILGSWLCITSPVTFWFSSEAFELVSKYQEAFVAMLWVQKYGEQVFEVNTLQMLISKAKNLFSQDSTDGLVVSYAYYALYGFFKYFIPAVYLALGTWCFVKILDSLIKVEN